MIVNSIKKKITKNFTLIKNYSQIKNDLTLLAKVYGSIFFLEKSFVAYVNLLIEFEVDISVLETHNQNLIWQQTLFKIS